MIVTSSSATVSCSTGVSFFLRCFFLFLFFCGSLEDVDGELEREELGEEGGDCDIDVKFPLDFFNFLEEKCLDSL